MFLDKMPNIFFNAWLWIGIAAVLLAIRYFFGKPQQPRKPSEFFLKHKKTIRRIFDGFLIIMLVFHWVIVFYFSITLALGRPKDIPPIPIHFQLGLFLIMSISHWGGSAIIIGMLSVFHSNLTKFKRLILLIISLIPIPLTILLLVIMSPEKPEELWRTIMSGLVTLMTCWLFNGPAIIAGKHFFHVAWYISRALRLTSGEYPEWR
jgi:hypothetical protein